MRRAGCQVAGVRPSLKSESRMSGVWKNSRSQGRRRMSGLRPGSEAALKRVLAGRELKLQGGPCS